MFSNIRLKEVVKTMSTERNIKLDNNDNESIDSALLFQRLIVLANSNTYISA